MGVITLFPGGRQALAALAALLLVPAVAAAQQCPPQGAPPGGPQLTLDGSMAETVYRNDRSRREISAIAGNPLGSGVGSNTGLTLTRTELAISPRMTFYPVGPGRSCVVLGEVEARWRLTEVVVDIASEYRPGTCQYGVVKEHEDQHVAFNRAAFRDYLPQLRARLYQLTQSFQPFITTKAPDQAGQEVVERLMKGVEPVAEAMRAELKRLNGSIDTPANYRAVSARCREW